MLNTANLNESTRRMKDWRRRLFALISALSLLISSSGVTAWAESDIYSAPVTAPVFADQNSPDSGEGRAEVTPAPEDGEGAAVVLPEDAEEGADAQGAEPAEASEPEAEPEEPLTVYEAGTLTAETDGITVTADYTADARVPEGAALKLERAAGGDLYSAMKSAAKVLKEETDGTWKWEMGDEAVFYTLTLADAEGNEIAPQTGVTLKCENLTIPADATGFVIGSRAENINWNDTLTVDFLPEAIGYAYLKQVQIGTVTLTHNDRDYMVTAAYGPEAGFPADTQLKVREILPGTAEYALYSGMTDDALSEDWSEITLERYFDIAFVSGGEEREPQADVDVQIIFRDKIEQNDVHEVQAVHIENNEATVIEADTESNKAAKHDEEAIDTVSFSSGSFSVYGVVQKKKIITKVLDDKGNTYEIEVTYTQEAEIPENAEIKVTEIEEGSDLWEAYRKQTAAALNADDVRLPGLYDISIIDEEGAKVEPKAPVNVAIKLANAENTQDPLHVVHFTEELPQELLSAESKPETQTEDQTQEQTEVQSETLSEEDKIASEKISASVEGDTVTFDTQSFSVYAFAYTVDFYFGEYEYHLEGDGSMLLSELFQVLSIDRDAAEATEVTFTDESLLRIEKTEDDWRLTSLLPFKTEEKLTIVFQNGERITIRVTDYSAGYFTADWNNGYLKVSDVPFDNKVVYDANLVEKGIVNGQTVNKYRLYAIARDGKGFWKWTCNTGYETHDSYTYTTSEIAPGAIQLDALQRGEVFTAYFYDAFRAIDVADDSKNFGKVQVGNGGASNNAIFYDNWKNANGKNKYELKAIPNDGYMFVRWDYYAQRDPNPTLMDKWVVTNSFYTQTISADTFAMERNEGWVLKAVFAKLSPENATVIDVNNSAKSDHVISATKKKALDQWLGSLEQKSSAAADKTAHVVDYDNRIYEIDFDVASSLMNLSAQIDLAFVVDVSNSMLFPANLVRDKEPTILTQENLNNLYPNGGTYYIISDPTRTSTVYRIFRDTDNIWYFVDASYSLDRKVKIESNLRYAEPSQYQAPFAYPIYRAADDNQRKYYLQNSLNNTITSLYGILDNIKKAGGTTSDIRLAWNTFASKVITTNDFRSMSNDSLSIPITQTEGGTRQDLALGEAQNYSWSNGKKYAVLITDGAPNYSADPEWVRQNVVDQANILKNQGVTLITIGLSTKDVTNGSQLLKEIASTDEETGKKLFFEAESGNDLQYVLLDALQAMMSTITVSGDIVDQIDPAFYPVTKDGNLVTPGFYNLDGTWCETQAAKGQQCYEWQVDASGNWTITYHNLVWGSDVSRYKTYIKAREDFLGGNGITTNRAAAIQTRWYYNAATNKWVAYTEEENARPFESPKVNVDELKFTFDNSSEAVKLGDVVNPKEKLQALFDKIDVLEVVSKEDSNHRKTADATMITDNGFKAKTFKLSNITGSLTDDQWNTLINGGTVSIPYNAYGHNGAGTIQISTTKSGVTGATLDINQHPTTAEGEPAETYTISAVYVPASTGAQTVYDKTTPGESAGALTNEIRSDNRHVIIVTNTQSWVVKLRKKDNIGGQVSGVKFLIYKENQYPNGTPIDPAMVGGLQNGYDGYQFVSDNLGRFYFGPIEEGTYYLVETEAPYGVIPYSGAIKLTINIDDDLQSDDPRLRYTITGPDGSSLKSGSGQLYKNGKENEVDLVVENQLQTNGTITIKKIWNDATDAKAVLFKLFRVCPLNNNIEEELTDVYSYPENYGLAQNDIFMENTTKYLKISKTGDDWPDLSITKLEMLYTKKDYPVTPYYYYVTEYGYIGADNQVVAIDAAEPAWKVEYSGTNAEEVAGHTAIKAQKEDPDTLIMTNSRIYDYHLDVTKEWQDSTGKVFDGTENIEFQLIRHEDGTTTETTTAQNNLKEADVGFYDPWYPNTRYKEKTYGCLDGYTFYVGDTVTVSFTGWAGNHTLRNWDGATKGEGISSNGIQSPFSFTITSTTAKLYMQFNTDTTTVNHIIINHEGNGDDSAVTNSANNITVLKPSDEGGYEVDPTGEYKFTLAPGEIKRFDNLPFAEGDKNYTYEVREITTGYTTTYAPSATYDPAPDSEYGDPKDGEIKIINKTSTVYHDPVDITVSKRWEDSETGLISWPEEDGQYNPEYISVKLQRRELGSTAAFEDVPEAEIQKIYPVKNEELGQYTSASYSHLDGGYEYTVVEMDTPAGFVSSVSASEGQYTLTNTKIPTTSVTATKDWGTIENTLGATALQFALMRSIDGSDAEEVARATVIAPDWTVAWDDLEMFVDAKAAEKVAYTYSVVETGVYFGTLPPDNPATEIDESRNIPQNAWITDETNLKISDIYVIKGGKVQENRTAITNEAATVDIPVEKTWADMDADSKYDWTATFRLQWAPLYEGETKPSVAYEDVVDDNGTKDITITKARMADKNASLVDRTFRGLPKYGVDNYGLYKILYSVKEIAYEVKENGQRILYYNEATGEREPADIDQHFASRVEHVAGATGDAEDDYVIQVSNNNSSSPQMIVYKEWVDVIDSDDMPGIYFSLYRYRSDKDPDHAENRELVLYHQLISKDTHWMWTPPAGTDLPETDSDGTPFVYYVDEDRVDDTRFVQYDNSHDTNDDDSAMVQYRRIVMKGIRSSQGHATEAVDNPKPYQAYLERGTGTLTITNYPPGGFIQMDIKKKFLEYRNGGELWTTTHEVTTKTNKVIEVQIYRRAVENKEVQIGGDFQLASGYTLAEVEGWEKYGNPIRVGYRDDGSEYLDRGNNDFPIESGDGDWHWTIARSDHHRGLPKYGYTEQGRAVKYQYVIVETHAYRFENGGLVDDGDLVAVLPAVWQGQQGETYAQAQQIKRFPAVVAQDQDRLINIPAASLQISKAWTGMPEAQKIYVKLYRHDEQNYNYHNGTDVTNILNSRDYSFQGSTIHSDASVDNYASNVYVDPNTHEKYICLSEANNWTVTVHHAALGSNRGTYYYWFEEVGYDNGEGTFRTDVVGQFTPGYSIVSGTKYLDAGRTKASPAIILERQGSNHLKVENTSHSGSLRIIKSIPVKASETAAAETDFTFEMTLTPAEGKTIKFDDLTLTGGTMGAQQAGSNGQVIFTVTIRGAGTATIEGIPYGTTYEVVETSIPEGWAQDGEVIYSDTDHIVSANDEVIDTATITNKEITEIGGTKTWINAGTNRDNSKDIKLSLTRKIEDGTAEPVMASPVWTGDSYSFTELDKYDAEGRLYAYDVDETEFTYDGHTYTVTKNNNAYEIRESRSTVTSWEFSKNGFVFVNERLISITLLKTNGTEAITGAKFKLAKKQDSSFSELAEYQVDNTSGINIADLKAGEVYRLEETQAPAGHVITQQYIYFKVEGDEIILTDESGTALSGDALASSVASVDGSNKLLLRIKNTPGVELPSTGGSGTLIYTITGMALVMLAGTLLVSRKKRKV